MNDETNVGTSPAEKTIGNAFVAAHKQEFPDAAIDPITIITVISALLEAIRNCRNQTSATAHLKRGSALVFREARRRLYKEGYTLEESNKLARNLQQQSAKLSDEQIVELVEESKDVPVGWNNGFWPIAMLLALFLMPATVQAGNFWPLPTQAAAQDLGPDRIVFEYLADADLKSWQGERAALEKSGWKFGPEPTNHIQLVKVPRGTPRLYKLEQGQIVRTFPLDMPINRSSIPKFYFPPSPGSSN